MKDPDLTPPPAAPDVSASNALVPTFNSGDSDDSGREPPDPSPDDVDEEMEAYGLHPSDYHWVPVLKKRRADGWSPQRQRDFIAALADSGSVQEAAKAADMSPRSCYRLRRSPGSENFAAAWDAAVQQASLKLVDIAFERAINGVIDRVEYDEHGAPIEPRRRYNDRLLMFLLRAHQPDRYRFANHDARLANEPDAPRLPSIPDAMARLQPPTPAAPHLLAPGGDAVGAMQAADIYDGILPERYRPGPGDYDPGEFPMGIEFERKLSKAKRNSPAKRSNLAEN